MENKHEVEDEVTPATKLMENEGITDKKRKSTVAQHDDDR